MKKVYFICANKHTHTLNTLVTILIIINIFIHIYIYIYIYAKTKEKMIEKSKNGERSLERLGDASRHTHTHTKH